MEVLGSGGQVELSQSSHALVNTCLQKDNLVIGSADQSRNQKRTGVCDTNWTGVKV